MLMNTHEARLDALRGELKRRDLDGFVVPISDEHMSEYVGAYAQRLSWLTGFEGSAGTAVVLTDPTRDPAAAMFVDGRYTLQVRDQVDGKFYAYESVPETSAAKWLGEHAPQGARIGYDPWLHGKRWVAAVSEALTARDAMLIAVESNPIDAVWADQPAPSPAPALIHADSHAGEASAAKREAISLWLEKANCDAVVICALDSIAWLLNVRGSDIDRTPVVLANIVVHAGGKADLFIAPEKVTPALRAHLGEQVTIRPAQDFTRALADLRGLRVAADPDSCVQAVFKLLEDHGATVVEKVDPCALPKATKNPVEQQGHRDAQARDGAAVARFLHWLSGEAPKGTVSEMAAADKLQSFREATNQLRDLSFDTISGSGPNGAVVHYRVSEATNRALEPGSVYAYLPAQAFLGWDLNYLARLERWQQKAGPSVRGWLGAAGELESLSALAALSADHPEWAFPELDPTADRFAGVSLGHPLLADDQRVVNDLTIGPAGTFLLITGSNMSGKSTLLRSAGVNIVLAQAGGPVCAESLVLPPVSLWTSVRVQDSLREGVSFFMAELLRLKQVVDAANARSATDPPVFFILDEMLQGTNTAERQIAARRIIRHLVDRGNLGAVSTHDLTLADGPQLGEIAVPVHLTETVRETDDGPAMVFDYKLRAGIARSTNALKLMDVVGFDFGDGKHPTLRIEREIESQKLQAD